jgi:AcrR family transcriptional regulator
MNPDPARPASSLPADSGTPRRRRKDARPSELTAAALALFVEKGFAGTRLDDVAARAGVSKGTLYLYFDGKEALFKAVIEDGMVAALATAEQRLLNFQGTSTDLLHELLFGWWERIGSTPIAGVTKLIASESSNFPEVAQYYHDQVIARGRALLRRALQRGIASGEFRPLDVEAAVDVIMAPLLMLAISRFSLRFCGQASTPEAFLATHLELLLRGLWPTDSHADGQMPRGSA